MWTHRRVRRPAVPGFGHGARSLFEGVTVSFRLKVLVSFLSLVIVSIGSFYFWANHSVRKFVQEMMIADLERTLEILAPMINSDDPNLDADVDALSQRGHFRVTVIAPNGRVIADSSFSGAGLAGMENHSGRPEVLEAWATGRGSSIRHSTSVQADLFYVARPLPEGKGILRLSQKQHDIEAWSIRLRRALAVTTVLLILSGGVLGWFLSRRLTRSIGLLSDAAIQIGGGHFIREIPVAGEDEVGELARQMESLSHRLDHQLTLLESERNHLTTVLNSMSEGVLVIDRAGRVEGTNPAFNQMFNVTQNSAGMLPLDLTGNTAVSHGIEAVRRESGRREMEIHAYDRAFLARFATIRSDGETRGVVVVFHDITELRRLEGVHKDFISNVSHELKTPLTSIQGYAETLLEEQTLPAVFRGFAEKIYRNARQLSEMIEELFSLSRLEQAERRLRLREVHFDSLVQDVAGEFQDQFEDKELELRVERKTRSDLFQAAEGYIRRVFRNLIENAVKYTEDGLITISMARKGDEFVFSVRDTGIGIAPEHLGRIFERFYRVDKDRSRRTGGTGIGLAIVKHIVKLHNGRVWAESNIGQGTTIFFTVPAMGGDLGGPGGNGDQ